MDSNRKLIMARSDLLLKHPFFGTLALHLPLQEDKACNGVWTDGNVLAYNPFYIEKLSKQELQGLVAHTVMHPACQHHLRRNGRDDKLWNMACDYAINWILLEAGFELPEGFLDDEKFRGKKAEAIYSELSAELDSKGNPENAGDKDGPKSIDVDYEEGPAKGSEKGLNDESEEDESEGDDDSSQPDKMESDAVESDTSDEGEESDSESAYEGIGEVRDSPDDSSGGNETPAMDWHSTLVQALNKARECGDLPGGFDRFIDSMIPPKLDWRAILDKFISSRAKNDYSWIPPGRRYIHMDLYLPSLSAELLSEVVLAVDTSGSISDNELNSFSAEISDILSKYDTTLRVLWCDMKVVSEQVFNRLDLPLKIEAKGGGGTDFRPPFDWVDDNNINPSCLIYFTDMECSKFPEYTPDYPVLWVRSGGGLLEPPFGDLIDI
ncbi:vWA domain-containing protein [Maridesulfovibrio bastinii]|uniref:vWA domain-containing protein n=1 Tax=Maridesulfovibrio bastinii TaxID=47157 RepID=UPI00047F601D|nr:VWA-like domain-containing protein [Maridesulfovibrio bastinii]